MGGWVGGMTSTEVAVIGGGIMGLAVAAAAATQGFGVCLVRQGDEGRPRADTLRNQGWLQSGLLHLDRFKTDRPRSLALAARMYAAGTTMLDELGIPPLSPDTFGVLRTRSKEEIQSIRRAADELRMAGVRTIEEEEARLLLGPLFEQGHFVAIPDVPFPEAEVLTRLRNLARAEDVSFVQTDDPVRLTPDTSCAAGARITSSQVNIRSEAIVAAGGVGNRFLLNDVGINPRMSICQTPLLVVPHYTLAPAPLFADRTRGFSLVRHEPGGSASPCCVIGTVERAPTPHVAPEDRRISQRVANSFFAHLPSVLRENLAQARFTAGYEPIPDDECNRDHLESFVAWVDGYQMLIAMPGRATTGMLVANEVVDALRARLGDPVPSTRGTSTGWNSEIRMHFDADYTYDDLDRSGARA
jgi:glycine/D-amino acid oxidase-like deaminating enzyme